MTVSKNKAYLIMQFRDKQHEHSDEDLSKMTVLELTKMLKVLPIKKEEEEESRSLVQLLGCS
jgi:hypothetical protein